MKHDSASSVGDDIPARDAFAAMLGIESKLGQLSEQLTRISNSDWNTRANLYPECRHSLVPDRSFPNMLASVETSERRADENLRQFGDHLDALGEQFVTVSGGRAEDTLKARQESPINVATWPAAAIEGDRPPAPAIARLDNHIADLADRLAGHEAAQEDLRKLVQSGFGRLDQRIDAAKQASEAAGQRAQNQARQAQEELRKLSQSESGRLGQRMDMLKQVAEGTAQRAQNQGVRLAQEELRKLAQSEFGRLHQRMDVLKQAAEAAAQRAQDQATQQAQKDLRDLEVRMQNLVPKSQTSAATAEGGEIGRLRDEMESLGQRVDDLTVKAASEHDIATLRSAIEDLAARVAHGPDLKPLADLDRRLTEVANRLEQSRGNHVGSQIDTADLDKRIAAAMRQNHISPPWTIIERKLAGLSDRLANTEMQLQYIGTLEKWILQLYRNLEETVDWTSHVAEDAANRMASRLVEKWSSETNPAATSAEAEPLENALAAVTSDEETADARNQKALGAVNKALEQIISKLSELEQIVSKLSELEQLRDQLQEVDSDEVLAETAPDRPGTERAGPEACQPDEMQASARRETQAAIQDNFLAAAVQGIHIPTHSLAESGDHKGRPDGARHERGSRFSLRLRKRERFYPPAGAVAYAPTLREPAYPSMRRWLIVLVLLGTASLLVSLLGIDRTKPLAALAHFVTNLGSDVLAGLLPEAANAAAGGTVVADADGPPSDNGPANCQQVSLHRAAKTIILRRSSPTTCRGTSKIVYPR
jgi:localization factor PodJL